MMRKFLIVAAEGQAYGNAQAVAMDVKSELARLGAVAHLATEIDVPNYHPSMVITVGGDGTIMRALKKYSPYGIPTFGINGGKLGFLAGAEIDDWEMILPRLIAGEVQVDECLALALLWRNQEFGPFANEVFVRHIQYPVTYKVTVDDTVLYDALEARGFMLSTATGSNAENASNQGVSIFPTSLDVALTPMGPQNPGVRSFAIPQLGAGGKVTITFLPGKYEGMTVEVWADGTKFEIQGGDMQFGETLTIRQHSQRLILATFGLSQHIRALKKKGYAL